MTQRHRPANKPKLNLSHDRHHKILSADNGYVGQRGGYILSFIFLVIIIVLLVLLAMYVAYQDRIITSKFEGKRWNVPAKVFSQPLELYQGVPLTIDELESWLQLLNYQKSRDYHQTGTYTKKGDDYYVHTRDFTFSNNNIEPSQVLKIKLADNHIAQLQSTRPNTSGTVRLEPVLIGGIYPDNNEDRIVLSINDFPQPLINALIATEDRTFYEHHGISIRGTARAFYSNLRGGARQGGSTITQQLVKNFYLTSDRTFKRKANEAVMAILLELHYSKDDILQTYMNEINLGQNGNHSVNGFGLAAQFYFNKPLNELRVDQLALLAGLAKGPTQYNPLRYPDAAITRRNVVLNNMLVMGKIDQATYNKAIQAPLDIVKNPSIGKSRFPDYLDIVKRELNRTYPADDLKNEGLRIFTSFNPNLQKAADSAVQKSLANLKKNNPKQLADLQAALVSADPQTGELLAVVGSRTTFTGFNRAVDAKRQVGSLLKPIIYLTAFEQGKYNLASSVDDSAVNVKLTDGTTWTPSNYGSSNGGGGHGKVPLMTALANSYNQAAVHVGLDVGVPNFLNQLYRMGITTQLPTYPASLLGTVNLSPMDMLGLYQVLSTGGFKHDIHTIRLVVDSQGRTVAGNSLKNQQVINASAAYLTNYAMQQVVKDGTAKAALSLGENLNLAGKTGTTNDYRDAWFAGYSGNNVSVVWVGRDDNQPTGLSGGSGALPLWINYMQQLKLTPVELTLPGNTEWQWMENGRGILTSEGCPHAIKVPVDTNNLPQDMSECATAIYQRQQEERFAAQRVQDANELYQSQQQRLDNLQNQSNNTTSSPPENQPLNPEQRSESWLKKSVKDLF